MKNVGERCAGSCDCLSVRHSPGNDRWLLKRLASIVTAESMVALMLLTALAAVVYGKHVLHGGFAWDDWENAATTCFGYREAFVGPFDVRQAVYEPGLTAVLPIPHMVFGLRPAWHLGLAVLLGVAMSFCTFKLLRELEVPTVPAAVAGALSLVFPWSDSTRLWATAGVNQVAVCLYLAGATLGLRGLELEGPAAVSTKRRGVALTAASVLTYPVTIFAVIAMPVLYRLRAPWNRAWRAGLAPALVGLGGLAYVSLATSKPIQPFDDQVAHVETIVTEYAMLLATSTRLPVAVFAVLVAAATVLALVTARGRANRHDVGGAHALRFAVAMLWAGAFAGLLAYLIFVPAGEKYTPLAAGLYNRSGILAGPAVAATAVGAIMLLTELTVARVSRIAVAPTSLLLSALLLIVWGQNIRSDGAAWDRSAEHARNVLATIDEQLPLLAPATTIYTVGHPRYEADGIPVFSSSFDLDAAIKIRRRDPSIKAFALPGTLRCDKRSAAPSLQPYERLERAAYSKLYVLNVARQRAWPIRTRRDCERVRVLLR